MVLLIVPVFLVDKRGPERVFYFIFGVGRNGEGEWKERVARGGELRVLAWGACDTSWMRQRCGGGGEGGGRLCLFASFFFFFRRKGTRYSYFEQLFLTRWMTEKFFLEGPLCAFPSQVCAPESAPVALDLHRGEIIARVVAVTAGACVATYGGRARPPRE